MSKMLARARANAPSIGFLVILTAFSGIVAACSGWVQLPPTPTLRVATVVQATITPTPTRVIGAIEATQTPSIESWNGTLETQGTLPV